MITDVLLIALAITGTTTVCLLVDRKELKNGSKRKFVVERGARAFEERMYDRKVQRKRARKVFNTFTIEPKSVRKKPSNK